MPIIVEKCVKTLLAKSDFKPKKGRTREESAWAICTAMHKEGKLKSSEDLEEVEIFAKNFEEDFASVDTPKKGEYIHVRVAGKFGNPDNYKPNATQEGSTFITKWIDESKGIKARMGIPKGEKGLRVQVYLFDKDKWTEEKAKAWVEKHEEKHSEGLELVESFAQETLDDITTIAEAVGRREASDAVYKVIDGFYTAFWNIMQDEEITDKKSKILSLVSEFKKVAEEKLNEIGDFAEKEEVDVITFSRKVEYQIAENQDGTVNITNLPVFELGVHRDFDYNEDWAKNVVIAGHNKLKEENGFLPPVFVGHDDEPGKEKPKVAFLDNLKLDDKILTADVIGLPKDLAQNYPYRSVEIPKATRNISGLALLGKTPPYFKFEPVKFKEGDDEKIYLTFKDFDFNPKGGERMGNLTFELAPESKNFFEKLFNPVVELFKAKKTPDDPTKKDTFSKEEVEKMTGEAKKKAEEDTTLKFKEEEKKKDLADFSKILFKSDDKDQKGKVFAPALKPKIEALLSDADISGTIKFSENGKEIEVGRYQLLKDIFQNILISKEAIIELGEKTSFQKLSPPIGDEKFSDDQLVTIGKEAAAGVNPPKEKK